MRLMEISDIVTDLTGNEYEIDDICSTAICQMELTNYEKIA